MTTESPGFTTIEEAVRHLVATDPQWAVSEAEIRGVRYRVFAQMPNNLGEVFAFGAMHGDADFLVYQDQRLSFGETYARACQLAYALIEDYGVTKGDRVAIAMRNRPEFIIAYEAAIMAGAVATPLNAWWTGPELDFALKDSGAAVVIGDTRRLDRIADTAKARPYRMISTDERHAIAQAAFDSVIAGRDETQPPAVEMGPDDPAILMYTSGSTGYPKGVLSDHRGVLSTLKSWLLLLTGNLMVPDPDYAAAPEGRQLAGLLCLPLFHITATHGMFMMSLFVRRKVVMIRKWDVGEALRLIEAERITHVVGVPTMTHELALAAPETSRDISSLIELGSGGAKRPPYHVARQRQALPKAAAQSGYGLTETNALGTIITRRDYEARPDAAGRIVPPLAEAKIVDEAGAALPVGEVGEICIKSPSNMVEYWNRPDDTAEALDAEGFLRTGDLGRFDREGFLYIQGRVKDMILRSGENIAALEVEACLYEHPDIVEIAVFGVPDERLGEIVAAAVVLRDGASLTEADLRAFAGARLARFKIPEKIWILTERLPRGGTAKIDKLVLKARYAQA